MKKLLILLALIPFVLSGQIPADRPIDLSKYHDANRLWEMADLNFNKLFHSQSLTVAKSVGAIRQLI